MTANTLIVCAVSGTVFNILHVLTHLILTTTPEDRHDYYHTYVTEEKTKAQGGCSHRGDKWQTQDLN